MILRILDTDHVSLLERKDTLVVDKFSRLPVGETAITIIKINTGCGKLSDFSPEREAARGTSVKSVLSFLISRMMRVFDVFPNNFTANIACGTNKIAARP